MDLNGTSKQDVLSVLFQMETAEEAVQVLKGESSDDEASCLKDLPSSAQQHKEVGYDGKFFI